MPPKKRVTFENPRSNRELQNELRWGNILAGRVAREFPGRKRDLGPTRRRGRRYATGSKELETRIRDKQVNDTKKLNETFKYMRQHYNALKKIYANFGGYFPSWNTVLGWQSKGSSNPRRGLDAEDIMTETVHNWTVESMKRGYLTQKSKHLRNKLPFPSFKIWKTVVIGAPNDTVREQRVDAWARSQKLFGIFVKLVGLISVGGQVRLRYTQQRKEWTNKNHPDGVRTLTVARTPDGYTYQEQELYGVVPRLTKTRLDWYTTRFAAAVAGGRVTVVGIK